jgi:hypothetical protein
MSGNVHPDGATATKIIPELKIDGTPVTVYYHQNCSDGFGAAYSAWKRLSGAAPFTLVPVSYGDPLPDTPHGEIVYILDFSFDPAHFLQLRRQNRRVIVLDHHQTAFERMRPLFPNDPDIYFDMNRSGAALSWAHFHPGEKVPSLIRLIEDKDLWRWECPNSLEVNTAIASYPFDLALWEKFDALLGKGPVDESNPLVQEGKTILRYQRQIMLATVRETARKGVFPDGEEGLFVNSAILNSEIGGLLKDENPMIVIWSHRKDGRIAYSLRSSPTGPDVAKIAEKFGGGGHKRAAGFISAHIIHRPL